MPKPLLLSVLVVACSSSPDPVEDGRRLFAEKGCEACHSVDGTPRIGPSLQAAFGRRVQLASGQTITFDEPYFLESVLDPDAKVVAGFPQGTQPSFREHLDEADLAALIAYVRSR